MRIETPTISMGDDGIPVINLADTELNLDWIRSARLKEKMKQGDERAKMEFDALDSSRTYVEK